MLIIEVAMMKALEHCLHVIKRIINTDMNIKHQADHYRFNTRKLSSIFV